MPYVWPTVPLSGEVDHVVRRRQAHGHTRERQDVLEVPSGWGRSGLPNLSAADREAMVMKRTRIARLEKQIKDMERRLAAMEALRPVALPNVVLPSLTVPDIGAPIPMRLPRPWESWFYCADDLRSPTS